jgi:hypothetical protein
MHKERFWAGVALLLVALLPAIGLSFGVIPAFSGVLLVAIATAGGYLIHGHGMAHGAVLYAGIALVLIALLPSLGFALVPALALSGPVLVIVAALGGYLLAKPSRGPEL